MCLENGFVKRVRVDANNPDASETMVLQEQKFIEVEFTKL